MTSPLDASSLFRVNGLVAVVTGGGSGIGLYIARALDANGAKAVYIVGRREETLKTAAASAINGTIIPVVGDVSSKESLAAVADRVAKDHGYVNAVVANAGMQGFFYMKLFPGHNEAPPTAKEFHDEYMSRSMEDFTQTMHVNTTGVFYTAVAFLELLVAGNERRNVPMKSQVLITTSTASFTRKHAGLAYLSSKAATTQLAKSLSTHFVEYGVRVNTLAPGYYTSEMSDPMFEKLGIEEPTKEGAFPKSHVPAQRAGGEEDMAGNALYMLSKAGGFLNGTIVLTDGGMLSQRASSY